VSPSRHRAHRNLKATEGELAAGREGAKTYFCTKIFFCQNGEYFLRQFLNTVLLYCSILSQFSVYGTERSSRGCDNDLPSRTTGNRKY
jgi:hypothetical protein